MASGDDKKIEKRKSRRIPLQVNAVYLEENKQEWQDCTIFDVSNDGMGILLYLREPIHLGTKLSFSINIALKIFQSTGTVIWFKKLQRDMSFNSALGVKLAMPDNTSKGDLYKHACSKFLKSNKKWEEEKYFL